MCRQLHQMRLYTKKVMVFTRNIQILLFERKRQRINFFAREGLPPQPPKLKVRNIQTHVK